MADTPGFLTQLVRAALSRGGGATQGESEARNHSREDGRLSPLSTEPLLHQGPDGDLDRISSIDLGILDVLAQKVLLAWLRNRYQLLFPLALDLRRLGDAQAELFVHGMIAAAQADGSFDGKERERIQAALNLVDPGDDQRAFLDEVIARPRGLFDILSQVRDIQTGALVYAASLMAVDHRKPVNRFYLKYLAARLQLSEELVDSLERRYRSSA